jgi:hypothetical protein
MTPTPTRRPDGVTTTTTTTPEDDDRDGRQQQDTDDQTTRHPGDPRRLTTGRRAAGLGIGVNPSSPRPFVDFDGLAAPGMWLGTAGIDDPGIVRSRPKPGAPVHASSRGLGGESRRESGATASSSG